MLASSVGLILGGELGVLQAPIFELSLDPAPSVSRVFDSLSYLAAVRRIIALTANVIMLTLWYHYSFEELLKFKFS
jgi:hypothetical protein